MAFSVQHVRAIAITLPIIATLAVAARFYVRKLKKAKYGADDWTILTSLILTWALTGIVLRGTVIGVYGGYHPPTARVDAGMIVMTKFHFSLWLMAIACVGMIKISVLLLYRRVFFAERIFYIYCTCLCVAVALWATGFFFARVFMCGKDVSLFWKGFAIYKRKCVIYPISNGFGISDIITDALVVISPIPIVWRLRLPKLQRAGVVGMFALGFLSTAAGAARGYIVLSANHEARKIPVHPVVLGTNVAVWSVIEITMAVIAACLVTLRPLVSGEHVKVLTRRIKSAISLLLLRSSSSRLSRDGSTDLRNGEDSDSNQHHDKEQYFESGSESSARV
ncbi:unnamed protein product [Periconia digitata]|uniref:Rhodopsin domain-containing protein n=1 Tax=Periconia digitata TaxID=1303443 RepID=A0A9W4U0W0_9PLEO|nr:unnamed protein product [Periconia digitata]